MFSTYSSHTKIGYVSHTALGVKVAHVFNTVLAGSVAHMYTYSTGISVSHKKPKWKYSSKVAESFFFLRLK